MDDTYRFHEFDIPVSLMAMTGGGPDTFEAISGQHITSLQRHVGLAPEFSVLEIGCGIGRDAIPLTKLLSSAGAYTGVDIIEASVRFCAEAITPRYPNFQFIHFDVADQLHNPGGARAMTDFALPLPDASVDRAFAWSVFTHMYEHDIRYYLKEIKRVLKPEGKLFATCFIFDEAILETAQRTNLTPFNLRFDHELSADCRINDPQHPLGAIAYRRSCIDRMIADSGLRPLRDFLRGGWSGHYADPEDGQDVMVLAR